MESNKENSNSGLSRQLGLFTAIMVVVGSMIGSGVFKKITPMSSTLLSSNLVLLSWLFAGLISIFGALSFVGLSKLTTEAGGQYQYLKIAYGKFFSFLYGWSCFAVIQTASISSIAYVFGESVNNLIHLPRLSQALEGISLFGYIFPLDNIGVKLITIAAIVFITIVNYCGVKYGGLFSNIFSLAKILGVFLLVALALFFSSGSFANIRQPSLSAVNFHPSFFKYITLTFAAMLSAFWAYDGWANITFLSGELKNCRRDLPIAIVAGVLGVTGIYLLTNFSYFYVLPIDSFIELAKSKNTIAAAEVVSVIVGGIGYFLLSILIMISTFGATNNSALASARIYYAMAKENLFFKGTQNAHPKYHTPHKSLILQCIWACVLVMSGTFDQLTDMLIFAAFIFYGSAVFGLFVLKRKKIITEKPFGYPIIPAIFVLFCIVLVLSTIVERPGESIIGLVLILLGIPFYLYWSKSEASRPA